jgi:Zn-dependent M28 family amino/carboxypeptidase
VTLTVSTNTVSEVRQSENVIGSPNAGSFVYGGDASDTASTGSTGSGVVEDVFVDFFESIGRATEPTAFDGRSDYDAFVTAGIPAGGLFTAEDIKTAEQAANWGGPAGVAFDPCYHAACAASGGGPSWLSG